MGDQAAAGSTATPGSTPPKRTGDAELIFRREVGEPRRIVLGNGRITIGRSPEADLQLDPHQDLTVSGLHAELRRTQDGWVLTDLDSLNGTLVNGHPVSRPVLLRERDQIQFGPDGPVAEFHGGKPASGPTPSRERDRSNRALWATIAVLSFALIAVFLAALQSQRAGRRYREQALAMQERIDSILDASDATAAALQGRIEGLDAALTESRENLRRVRTSLETAEQDGDSEEIQSLRVQLQEAQAALVRQQLAANLDYEAIESGNRRAVAKVFVDFGDAMVTATAFAVRPDGTFLTNRHVVEGASGTRTPLRLAVQFADSRQVWQARVLATAPADDLAALKVDDILGNVPTIKGFASSAAPTSPGQPVAVIGFPLGGADSSGEEGRDIARTTLTAGIVSTVAPDVLEVAGYGVEGSSGSPVLNANGEVIGVLFGGRVEEGERTLFAVPASRAAAFLRQVR